jgi:hypothetical protein
MASVEEYKEWKEFRQALDKSDKKAFDAMFDIAHLCNSSCSYAAKTIEYIQFLCLLYFITINS